MHLHRDFQTQAVQPDEAGGGVLVAGLSRVGFHRGVHGNQFTLFCGLWQPAFLPVQLGNQSAVSAVRAVAAAD
jgi:hypothetical protein